MRSMLVGAGLVVLLLVSLGSLCKKQQPPGVPNAPTGPGSGEPGVAYVYLMSASDPDGDEVSFQFDWGDGKVSVWTPYVASGDEAGLMHLWRTAGTYSVKARAMDETGLESEWSDSVQVRIWEEESLDIPVVGYEAIATGAVLRLTWTAVTHAESYEVMTDDSTFTTNSLSFDVTAPTAFIEVRAVNGSNRSDPASIDCRVVETSSRVLYGSSDPDTSHRPGLAFTVDGSAVELSLADANKASLDFVCDDQNVSPVGFVNAGDYGWPQNSKINALIDAGTTDYDALVVAAASGYMTQLEIAANAVYALWLSISPTWTVNDHFCKAKIVSIEDVGGVPKVTLKAGYQKIGGLRWLKTN